MGYVIPEREVAWRRVDDEVLVLQVRTGYYYSLNGTGALVWEALAKGEAVPRICARLRREYAVAAAVAERDVSALLADLAAEGLLTV